MNVLNTTSHTPTRPFPIQQRQYFLLRSDLKLGSRTHPLQASPHGIWGIKQLEFNPVLPAPLLKEHEHTQTATAERFQFREVEQNHADGCLLGDSIAQLEGGITTTILPSH
jgi:hypothetical protein